MAIGDWTTDEKSYSGLLGGAFIILLLSNILDLIFSWQEDRRKQDWGIDERKCVIDEREYNRQMNRQAD